MATHRQREFRSCMKRKLKGKRFKNRRTAKKALRRAARSCAK